LPDWRQERGTGCAGLGPAPRARCVIGCNAWKWTRARATQAR
jgi:hypothetical protein